MNDTLSILRETYIKEIADNYIDDPHLTAVLNGLCSILLGEKIPVTFVDKSTGQAIIASKQKLTKRLLRELAILWLSGEKFELKFDENGWDERGQKNFVLNILKVLSPTYSWH